MTPAAILAGATAALTVAAFGARRAPHPHVGSATVRVAADAPSSEVSLPTAAAADELSILLDLLATATAAGMSGTVAFGAAGEALRGPLGVALRGVARSHALGASLGDGIRGVAASLDLPDLARAATLLDRSGSLGVPVSVALRELAAEHARARRRAAEHRARTAPIRMLFPLVFLVLPAFLLLTVVPMLLATLRSLS